MLQDSAMVPPPEDSAHTLPPLTIPTPVMSAKEGFESSGFFSATRVPGSWSYLLLAISGLSGAEVHVEMFQ